MIHYLNSSGAKTAFREEYFFQGIEHEHEHKTLRTAVRRRGILFMTRIAFVGKGGSGKTTLASLFSRYLGTQQHAVLAIDADINQHLGEALGLTAQEAALVPALGLEMGRIKNYLRGTNQRIVSAEAMIKTTPPGHGSRLVRVKESNPLYDYFGCCVEGVRLLATGPFSEEDLGLKCYHSKVGAVELLLNHCVDARDEYLVVDMTAGADSFASGLFTRFDLTCIVVEPTLRALGVYQQYKTYAQGYGVRMCVIGNKVESDEDVAFLRERTGNDLLTWIGRSTYVRAMEKGHVQPLTSLEEEHIRALHTIKAMADTCEKDWTTFYRQAIAFHHKNAIAWANAQAGEDLRLQIDPDFRPEDYQLQVLAPVL
jgi:CO dehydrogenase maturation factor